MIIRILKTKLRQFIAPALAVWALMSLFGAGSAAAADDFSYVNDKNRARISLLLNKNTDYNVENKANRINIRFSQPEASPFRRISQTASGLILDSSVSADNKNVMLTLASSDISVKNHAEGSRLIIDVEKNTSDRERKNRKIDITYGSHDTFSRFVFAYEKKPQYTVLSENGRTLLTFISDVDLHPQNLKDYPKAAEIKKIEDKINGTTLIFPEELLENSETDKKIILDLKKSSRQPPENDNTFSKQVPLALAQAAPQTDHENVASLSFSWNIAVGAASFVRNGYLWVIFDHTKNVDLDEIRKLGGNMVKDVIQIPHSQATVLRFTLPENIRAGMRQEGLLWIVDLYANDLAPQVSEIPLFTRKNPQNQNFLFAPTNTAGNVISVVDPEIGDAIIIAPLVELGYGINSAYSYPDVEILASGQGLAIVPNASDIWLNRGNTGLIIRAANRSMNITENLDSIKRNEEFKKNTAEKSSFDIRVSNQLLSEKFITAENQLKADIEAAAPEQKTLAQLELAKYYLAKGLGTNALFVLNDIRNSGAPEAQSDNYHALLGVAYFLNRHYDEAVENFSFGKLPEQNEAVFWRALASSARGSDKENNAVIISFISLIKDYPQELKERIALIGAQNAIDSNDDISAQNFLDILKDSDGNDYRKANISYLTAQKFELQGYPRNAIREYARIRDSISQKYSSLARFNKAVLEDKLNLIPPTKVISEFERLRYAWGETPFKIKLLDNLARAYVKNKDYYNALRTYKELLPITPDKEEVTTKMVRLFEDIYINNMADTMTPLKALALYQDFSWLAPKSSRYSLIAQKLADRLVAVDLLDRASEILYDQLRHRTLPELQRHKIGARLALIKLFENKNQEALGILESTEMKNAPESISHHRRIIKAKALSNIGDKEQALDLLKDDQSKNAVLLRSEIYWDAGMWNEASDSIKYLIEKPQPGKPLNDEQTALVLDWATALKKSGKETVIVRLRNRFLPYFENTPYYSTFNILTNNLEKDTIDINDINSIVNDVAAFRNFAKIYNQNLKDGNLSRTIN